MSTYRHSTLDNKSIIKLLLTSVAASDMHTLTELLDENFTAHLPEGLPWGGLFCGREAFLNRCAPLLNTYLDMSSLSIEKIFAEDDSVQVLLYLGVRGIEECQLLSETWTVQGGKVTGVQVFYFQLDRLVNVRFA